MGASNRYSWVVGSPPVEAVLRRTAVLVSLEAALGSGAPLVDMARFSLRVEADEHSVVIIGGFVDHRA